MPLRPSDSCGSKQAFSGRPGGRRRWIDASLEGRRDLLSDSEGRCGVDSDHVVAAFARNALVRKSIVLGKGDHTSYAYARRSTVLMDALGPNIIRVRRYVDTNSVQFDDSPGSLAAVVWVAVRFECDKTTKITIINKGWCVPRFGADTLLRWFVRFIL